MFLQRRWGSTLLTKKKIKMKFDSYSITGRVFPAILVSLPFFTLHFFYLVPKIGEFWEAFLALQIVADVTVPLVLLYLLMQLSRYVSKKLFEEKIFADGLAFPTTDYLLHLDTHFSSSYTAAIHKKIEKDFNIKIPSSVREVRDSQSSRKAIFEAISHIRGVVGNGNLVGQHNAEYGFVRNLAGGSAIAFVMSIIDAGLFYWIIPNETAFWVSIVLVILYLVYLLFAKKLITSFGHDYAKVLIQEYMLK